MIRLLLAASAAALLANPAQAAVFMVTGTFATPAGAPVGTLTGTFTTNDALTSVTAVDLNASAFGSFAGFHYTSGNSNVTAQFLPQYFQLDSTSPTGNELRLYFSAPLTSSGATISPTFSYEAEPSGGNRFPSGTVTRQLSAVPEAATWAMMLAGFGAVGLAMRRRQRVRAAIKFA